jgi:hypothetical protein
MDEPFTAHPTIPPECFDAMRCPFCDASDAWLERQSGHVIYNCWGCPITGMAAAEFCEKVAEVIAAERSQHAEWEQIIAALAAQQTSQ